MTRKVQVRATVRTQCGNSDQYMAEGTLGEILGRKPGRYLIKWKGKSGPCDTDANDVEIVR